MFMVKEEFSNIKNLFKVRLKMAKNQYTTLALVFTGLFLIPLTSNINNVVSNTANPYNNISDMSEFILFGVIIGIIVSVIIYRTANVKLSVFPQTNNSRLISSLMINYFTVALLASLILAMYLINLGIFKLLSAFSFDIFFALNINFRFIIAGFFVYITYSFLLVAIIELIGAVLRKWTYYAAAILTTLFILLVVNFVRVIEYLPRVLSFLIGEPSLLLFFLKAAGLWLGITAVTLVINRYTVFYKSHNQILKKGIVITCIIVAAVIIVFLPGVLFEVSYSSSESYWGDSFFADENISASFEEFTIDVSHLPAGSRINVEGININVMEPGQWVWSSGDYSAIVSGADSLYNIQGDTILIEYRPAWLLINGVEVLKYTNQQLSANLEGSTLYLNYTRDNVHVMLMPIWNLARQFDYFKDMGVLGTNMLGFTSGGNSTASLWISVE